MYWRGITDLILNNTISNIDSPFDRIIKLLEEINEKIDKLGILDSEHLHLILDNEWDQWN